MNIHKSQLFWCEQKGYKVLTHCHMMYKYSCICTNCQLLYMMLHIAYFTYSWYYHSQYLQYFYIHPSIHPSVHSSIHILSMYTYRRHVHVCVHMIISKCIKNIYIYILYLTLSLCLSLYIYICIVYIHVTEHHGRLTNGAAHFFKNHHDTHDSEVMPALRECADVESAEIISCRGDIPSAFNGYGIFQWILNWLFHGNSREPRNFWISDD